MTTQQADQLVAAYGSKFSPLQLNSLRDRLLNADYATAQVALAQAKDPVISLILSILLGGFGVDRMYIGDIGLGVFKLITCGGCYIWWLIDLFLIMDATRQKNFEKLALYSL